MIRSEDRQNQNGQTPGGQTRQENSQGLPDLGQHTIRHEDQKDAEADIYAGMDAETRKLIEQMKMEDEEREKEASRKTRNQEKERNEENERNQMESLLRKEREEAEKLEKNQQKEDEERKRLDDQRKIRDDRDRQHQEEEENRIEAQRIKKEERERVREQNRREQEEREEQRKQQKIDREAKEIEDRYKREKEREIRMNEQRYQREPTPEKKDLNIDQFSEYDEEDEDEEEEKEPYKYTSKVENTRPSNVPRILPKRAKIPIPLDVESEEEVELSDSMDDLEEQDQMITKLKNRLKQEFNSKNLGEARKQQREYDATNKKDAFLEIEIEDLRSRITDMDLKIEIEKKRKSSVKPLPNDIRKIKERNTKMDYEIERYKRACEIMLQKFENKIQNNIESNKPAFEVVSAINKSAFTSNRSENPFSKDRQYSTINDTLLQPKSQTPKNDKDLSYYDRFNKRINQGHYRSSSQIGDKKDPSLRNEQRSNLVNEPGSFMVPTLDLLSRVRSTSVGNIVAKYQSEKNRQEVPKYRKSYLPQELLSKPHHDRIYRTPVNEVSNIISSQGQLRTPVSTTPLKNYENSSYYSAKRLNNNSFLKQAFDPSLITSNNRYRNGGGLSSEYKQRVTGNEGYKASMI